MTLLSTKTFTMEKKKETPLFIMESEFGVFSNTHKEYNYYARVYYNDQSLAGYLAYKEDPNKQ